MLNTICPICKSPLEKKESSAVCKNGHSFDYAKEGYLNLLTPSKKHSQNPGDNKDMVLARKRFMDGGYYAPLAEAIADIICDEQKSNSLTLIDAGVGTGFYLNKIISARTAQLANFTALSAPSESADGHDCTSRACAHTHDNNIESYADCSEKFRSVSFGQSTAESSDVYLGADISKIAIRYAAKLNPSAECCVASVYDLPYADSIADIVTCVFSPYALEEYKRVLKPDGLLIIASPCENHLIELRRALYENVREVETPIKSDGFDVISEKELTYSFTLNNSENIAALLMMTPYAYRAPLDRKASLLATAELSLTADFKLSVLRPNTHRIDDTN